MSTLVKICGITRLEDARVAIDAGAGALGFNFSDASPRQISPADAQIIVRQLPPTVWFTGVFVNQQRDAVEQIARSVGLDTLQFHGDETAEFLKGWGSWRVIKALRVGSNDDLAQAKLYKKSCDHLLIDARVKGAYGGTGTSVEEDLLKCLFADGTFDNALLAGGLTPETVGDKVWRYKPFGVDVASGVETSPGIKDPARIEQFLQAVRDAD